MNRHIKIINGRKYYYSSIRKGRKVTSKYLGPVERIRKRKSTFQEVVEQAAVQAPPAENLPEQEDPKEDESYIG